MYNFSEKQFAHFFNYLETLDCYIKSEESMIRELEDFQSNPTRQIASLICQNNKKNLTYVAPYTRIIYILKGSIDTKINGKNVQYGEGTMVLANPCTLIHYQEKEPETMIINFYFKPEYFNDGLLNQIVEEPMLYRFFIESLNSNVSKTNKYCVYQFSTTDDIHFYALLLLKQIVKMRYFNNKVTKAAFVLLAVEISQMSENSLLLEDSDISSDVLIKEVLAYIENNVRTATLDKVAKKFHFHPNYLSSMIKKQTGRSYSDWLTNYRMFYAKNYLEQTNLSIQQIIQEIGYSDKTYFFKRFKEHNKMTPGEYRKFAKNKNEQL